MATTEPRLSGRIGLVRMHRLGWSADGDRIGADGRDALFFGRQHTVVGFPRRLPPAMLFMARFDSA